MACSFARVDIFVNVKFSFFDIQISHVASLNDGES